jgi:hypothetical protein
MMHDERPRRFVVPFLKLRCPKILNKGRYGAGSDGTRWAERRLRFLGTGIRRTDGYTLTLTVGDPWASRGISGAHGASPSLI